MLFVFEAGAGFGVLAVELAFRLRRRLLRTAGVDFAAVKTRPLLLVAENSVSGGNLLEAGFRSFVAGMQVRVVLLGETAVRLADFALRRLAGDAQRLVWVRH